MCDGQLEGSAGSLTHTPFKGHGFLDVTNAKPKLSGLVPLIKQNVERPAHINRQQFGVGSWHVPGTSSDISEQVELHKEAAPLMSHDSASIRFTAKTN